MARAFAPAPQILLADEPTGNLDQTTGHAVLEVMSRLHEQIGSTMVMVTHDDHVASLADRLILLEDGRIVSWRQSPVGHQEPESRIRGPPLPSKTSPDRVEVLRRSRRKSLIVATQDMVQRGMT